MEKIKNLLKNINMENVEKKVNTLLKITLAIELVIVVISGLFEKNK